MSTAFFYDQPKITDLFRRMDSGRGRSYAQRGSALEDLIVYLFECVPGVSKAARDIVNRKRSRELDVVFWNRKSVDWLDFLDNTVFVECKNWAEPLGSKEVSRFRDSLRRSRQRFGILVAASGITGDKAELNGAHDEIHHALSVDGIHILVITRAEIATLKAPEDLIAMLQNKICQVVCRGTSLA